MKYGHFKTKMLHCQERENESLKEFFFLCTLFCFGGNQISLQFQPMDIFKIKTGLPLLLVHKS